jgi:hypothetical protein
MKRALALLPAILGALVLGILVGRRDPGTVRTVVEPLRGAGADAEPAAATAAPSLVVSAVGGLGWTAVLDLLRRGPGASEEEWLRLQRRLARLLEEDPSRAMELLVAFERESDPDLLALLATILGKDAAAAANPEVVSAMLRAAQTGAEPERRAAALLMLMNLPQIDDAAVEAVLRVARDDAERGVRISAIAAGVAWMQAHSEFAAPLARGLVEVARGAVDEEIRGHAIQGLALMSRPPDADVVDALGLFVRDSNAQNRGLAAMALGGAPAESRDRAVAHLERAASIESSAETQRGMLIHLVRAAGAEAADALARLGTQVPRLAVDVRDYLEILKVEQDPTKVWELKLARDLARGVVPGAAEHTD